MTSPCCRSAGLETITLVDGVGPLCAALVLTREIDAKPEELPLRGNPENPTPGVNVSLSGPLVPIAPTTSSAACAVTPLRPDDGAALVALAVAT